MEDLDRRLGKAAPATVRVTLINGETRTLKPGANTRKRWVKIVEMLGRMEWRKIEMLDPRDNVLDFVDNVAAPAPLTMLASDSSEHRHLKIMIEAQTMALGWQSKQVQQALDACVGVMQQMGEAVHGIVELHRSQNESLRKLLHAAQQAAPAGEPGPQDEILKQLAPVFLAQLMAGPGPAKAGG